MERNVAIIGAGVSGLLACKYTLQKNLNPIVFEADEQVGGVWAHTYESTKLQTPKFTYEFSDFPWPSSIQEPVPGHDQVLEYIESYAKHFNLYPYIRLNSRVVGIDYVGGESDEGMEAWHLWGGAGTAFGSKGKWSIKVRETKCSTIKEYQAEFVILCIGQFSGLPNIPEFPPNQGPEVFNGKVLHSMDYSFMDKSSAEDFIRQKKITVIGSRKSAVDLAAECASVNGVDYPCTLIKRTLHWYTPSDFLPKYGHLFFTRFCNDLFYHKPGETFLQGILPTLFSPMRWLMSKLAEIYLNKKFPLKKYGMVPKERFFQNLHSCQLAVLPEKFYDKVEEGSIVLKNPRKFSFCKEGLLLEGEADQPLKTYVVIFATGFKGDVKLCNIFESPKFQKMMVGSPSSLLPLHRQIIHPRIPRLAVIGFTETPSILATSELRCQWLAQLLDNKMKLPVIREMEKELEIWGKYFKETNHGKASRKPCTSTTHFWHQDQLCKDMGHNPRRKKGFLADLFGPYVPSDYGGLCSN